LFPEFDSVVVVVTVPVLSIDEPAKDGSTSTVNVAEFPPLPIIVPRSQVTVPTGNSSQLPGSVSTDNPVGSSSDT
jgi:hypothetical protein